MNLWPFKKQVKFSYSDIEIEAMRNFMKGFETGIQLASEFDGKAREAAYQKALNEALERIRGNNKADN